MFEINLITLMFFLLFLYPLIKGFLFKFSSYGLKGDVEATNKNISFVISLILGVYMGKKIFIFHEEGLYSEIFSLLPQSFVLFIEGNTLFVYAVIMPVLILLLYKIFLLVLNFISAIIIFPLIDSIERFLFTRKNMLKRAAGAAFQIPRAACYVLLAAFTINIFSLVVPNEKLDKQLEKSGLYNQICKGIIIPVTNSQLAKQMPEILNNSFKIVIKDSGTGEVTRADQSGNTIVYYNGVTLAEGVRSNAQINEYARNLASQEESAYGKAEVLYGWVGNNITYDYEKATKVLNNDFEVESGAIPAFETGKGICFDYACLYVAMCRANNIKVRIVTGEGFNGVSWVSHAWNQVYIPERGEWINVDPTFYKGGNYFDSIRFELDHEYGEIAGEW
ncbi:MAG: putative rane-bound protein with a transglutaminase domain [Firmicutes bacterium]|nr:putative rane-bound protein with a transglutaminase domain [Bacillota bacterium]